MLIYNSQKEFIGIDEKDLQALGFSNLTSLKTEVSDFADLFVKTPGYIHNFKHVHWIDFISCAESSEDSQAIINVHNKNFKCKISIENVFLTDNASSKAYVVYLNNLRELTQRETEVISGDIVERPTLQAAPAFVAPEVVDEFDVEEEPEPLSEPVQEDPYETPLDVDFDNEDTDLVELDVPEVQEEADDLAVEETSDDMLDVGDLSFDEEETVVEEKHKEEVKLVHENFENGYTYDPHVASDELGLPLDLIEEFIQDFIAQAKEFKDSIYTALDEAEFDQVKILSHKLKGVAANLRIEDAFETLSIVNTSDDANIIKENLDTFYKIIAKLAGEEITVEKEIVETQEETPVVDFKEEVTEDIASVPNEENDEDDLYGDLLQVDDIEEVQDSQVPPKIDIPELADDEFLASDVDMDSIETEIENIEDIELLELDKEIELNEDEMIELEDEVALDLAEDIVLEEEDSPLIEYSKESVASEIGLDVESFNELFDDYLSESDIIIADIKSSIKDSDYKTCRHEALKLQGMSENMRLNSFMQELEVLTSSRDSDETTKAVEKIEQTISQLSRTGA